MTESRPTRSAKVSIVALSCTFASLLLWTLLLAGRLSAQSPAAPGPQQPGTAPAPAQPLDLSDQIVRDVLENFQRAVETRNFDRLLGTFDRESMKDFAEVREEFAAFFGLHDNIKFRYQLLQATAVNGTAFATADVDMEAQPADELPTEQRRSTQMRFQMKMTPKGWRIVGINPMDFFAK